MMKWAIEVIKPIQKSVLRKVFIWHVALDFFQTKWLVTKMFGSARPDFQPIPLGDRVSG